MGTGKTAVGLELAGRLGRQLIDTDDLVEEMTGLKVPLIFQRLGEEYFRERESEAVTLLERYPPGSLVVATGGGILLRPENRRRLQKNGLIVLLAATPETIIKRTKNTGDRPLLAVPDPEQKIKALLEEREQVYRHHDVRIDTTNKSVREVADEVVERFALSR